jgi:nitrogen fixation NifU-like protein
MSSAAEPGGRQEAVEFLLEHARSPSHHGTLEGADVTVVGGNPGCGDVVTVYLKVDRENDRVAQATFTGEGCTISRAAASVLMEQVQGVPLAEIEAMDGNDLMDTLGRDVVRSRPRCATLALSTLKGAVRQYRQAHNRTPALQADHDRRDGF